MGTELQHSDEKKRRSPETGCTGMPALVPPPGGCGCGCAQSARCQARRRGGKGGAGRTGPTQSASGLRPAPSQRTAVWGQSDFWHLIHSRWHVARNRRRLVAVVGWCAGARASCLRARRRHARAQPSAPDLEHGPATAGAAFSGPSAFLPAAPVGESCPRKQVRHGAVGHGAYLARTPAVAGVGGCHKTLLAGVGGCLAL